MTTPLRKRSLRGAAVLPALIFCLGLMGLNLNASAQTSGRFSIRAVIPENQLDKKQTYFDLRLSPGEEQTVQVVVSNSRPEELTVKVGLNAASTARDGLIIYTVPDVRDKSMALSLTDVASLERQLVTIAPQSTETVDIRIKMPEERFDGVLLGGFTATAEEPEQESAAEQGVSIKNTITYVIALKVTENDNEVTPDFELAAITPSLVNHRTAVGVSLRNKAARIVKNVRLKAEVFEKNSASVLHGLTLNEAELAPLSVGEFIIDWENEPLRPGAYRLKMQADYEGKLWEWDEEFVIAEEAEELNKNAVALKKDLTWLYAALALAALVLVGILAYRLGKRKRNDED